jgi:hypothetical protein
MLHIISLDRSSASYSGDEFLSLHDRDRVDAGSKAPDFTLLSQSEEMVNLREFLGNKPVVMVFQQYKEPNTLSYASASC